MSDERTNMGTRSPEVILGLLPLILGLQLMVWLVYLPSALHGEADFRNCYSSGLLLRNGRGDEIYNYAIQRDVQNSSISQTTVGMPYVHPPYEVLLFAPLSLLSYRGAFIAWLVASLVFLVISYRSLKPRLWRLRTAWHWLPILFFIGFMPVSSSLLQGQDSLLTLLLFSAALLALESGNELRAGVVIGLAAYKFQLVLPIAALFFLWHRWRFVLGASVSSFCMVLVSAWLSGANALLSYVGYVRETSVTFAALMPANRMPNLRGLISLLPLPRTVAIFVLTVVSVIVVICIGQLGRRASVSLQFALAISAATLLGYHVMMHDLSVMLVPMAVFLSLHNPRYLWSISLAWLTSGLCFFGLGPIVTIPFGILLICLAKKLHSPSEQISDRRNSTPRAETIA
jgi:hypothetical protein